MQCLPFFNMFPKRKRFQGFRNLGMFSVPCRAQHNKVHRYSQKHGSIHCNYICKNNFARERLLRDFTLECVKDPSLTVVHLISNVYNLTYTFLHFFTTLFSFANNPRPSLHDSIQEPIIRFLADSCDRSRLDIAIIFEMLE